MPDTSYTLQQLAEAIGAEVKGDAACEIFGMAPIESAQEGQITFVLRPNYVRFLESTRASAVVLHPEHAEHWSSNALLLSQPEVGYAKLAQLFEPKPKLEVGIHSSAIISDNCHISETCVIGPNVVIGKHVTIGENVVISPNCVIGDDCQIGDDCFLGPNVSLYHDVHIGDRCIIHSGVVMGADGFGMVNDHGTWLKIPQLGGVRVGDDVEVGANTTIDRGAMQNTIIGKGVKLDNQIQIAHNVEIGAHTAIAGCVAIGGSTKIGKHCMIGGAACIADHVEIADNIILAGMAGVSKSLKKPDIYASGVPVEPRETWRRNVVNIRRIGDLLDRVKELEKAIHE